MNRNRPITNVFEELEGRQMFSALPYSVSVKTTPLGPTLTVEGTKRSDRINISQSKKGITISDGKVSQVIKTAVKALTINGGNGNDMITISASVKIATRINGGNGNDVIRGGAGRDSINGGSGGDRIFGNGNHDLLEGNTGNDFISGGAGKDKLVGNAGDDILIAVGGGEADSLCGDGGFDSYWMDEASTEVVTDSNMLSMDEVLTGAVHRVDSFMNFVGTDGTTSEVTSELNGQNLADPEPNWNAETMRYDNSEWRNFYGNPLFNFGTPSQDDVHQGAVGDCYFLCTLSSIADTDPKLIQQSVVDFGDGTFGVRFIEGNSCSFVRVDGDLPVNIGSDGSVKPTYANLGNGNAMWVPVMEKAFTFFRQQANRTDGYRPTSYHAIDRGYLDEVPKALGAADIYTSKWATNPFANEMDLVNWIDMQLSAGRSVTYATNANPTGGLVELHAYSAVSVFMGQDGQVYVEFRNPWGKDGERTTDGVDDGHIYVRASDAFNTMSQVQTSMV